MLQKSSIFFVFILFGALLLSTNLFAGTSSATNISVTGTNITVQSFFELTGAGTPELAAKWQQALNKYYQTQLYKCYKIDYDLKVTAASQTTGLAGVAQNGHQVFVIDVLSEPGAKEAYEKYGLYDHHEWLLYDQAQGTDMAKKCLSYKRGKYLIECAEASQWFYDQEITNTVTLAYSTADDVDETGKLNDYNVATITNASKGQTFAHEAGHMLGIDEHADGETSLMHTFYDAHRTDIMFESLQDMLDIMKLECRWTFELNNENFSIVNTDSCPVAKKCIASLRGSANTGFIIESYYDTADGKGDTTYKQASYNLDINTGNCTSSTSPVNGKLKIEGMIESGDASLFASFVDQKLGGYNPAESMVLNLTTSYTQDPLENAHVSGPYASASIPLPMLKNMQIGGGFNQFKVIIGDPQDPKRILNKINFSHEFPLNHGCIQILWKLTTDDLKIIKVEPIKGNQV